MNKVTLVEGQKFVEWVQSFPVPENLHQVRNHFIRILSNLYNRQNESLPREVPDHPCTVVPYKGKNIEIDNLLLPLIQSLWNRGIETLFCCQGDPMQLEGDGNIVFADARSAQLFIDEIQKDGSFTICHEHWSMSEEFLKQNGLVSFDSIAAYRKRVLIINLAYGNLERGMCSLDVRFHNEQIEKLAQIFAVEKEQQQ